jgi:dolichyl-phosphate-mannose--protein O-mannosyl transferase
VPFEIKNRSVLKLRHKTSGKYLYSGGFLYPQAGSSRQQAVGASGNLDQTAEWFVKESHGTLGAPDLNNRFYDQNVIRLEHVSSTKNLHSHQGLQYSPIQGHHEVTCFGSLGEGVGKVHLSISFEWPTAD